MERLERLADAALYVAKRQGRNRVELAEPASVEALPDLTGLNLTGPDRADLAGPAGDGSGRAPVPAA